MAIRHRRKQLLPRLALSTLLGALVAAGIGTPGSADPDRVPDPGARPAPELDLELPDGTTVPAIAETSAGPYAAEIAATEIELEALATDLAVLTPETGSMEGAVAQAEAEWEAAASELATAQEVLNERAGEAFRGSAAVPDHLFGPRLRDLSAHTPLLEAPLGAEAAASRLARAQEAEETAAETLELVRAASETLAEDIEAMETELLSLEEELAELQELNTTELAEQEREREAAEQQRAPSEYPVTAPVDGLQPHPRALAAVEFALDQLGTPYQWGAQGPNRYDCSGLMWDAYRSVGETIPRVSRDQYNGTRDRLVTRSTAVAQQGLLPGDLVFFSPSPFDWQQIGHVGMYVGDGRMVHAPRTGDVVRVAPVWWSRFFAATRVIDGVPDPDAEREPTPSPTPRDPATPPGTTPPGSTPPGTTPPGSTPPGTGPPGAVIPGPTPPGSTAPPTDDPPTDDPPTDDPPSSTPSPTEPTPTVDATTTETPDSS